MAEFIHELRFIQLPAILCGTSCSVAAAYLVMIFLQGKGFRTSNCIREFETPSDAYVHPKCREKTGLTPPTLNHAIKRTGNRCMIDLVHYLSKDNLREHLKTTEKAMIKDSKLKLVEAINTFFLQPKYKYMIKGNLAK